ncbi:MAG TPA: cyclic nucleotide-binding domain-containing protein [Anaerolineae bacterium]|nr:cyclic nucleotide-binding domain-containing protein [Anaerolineae bacterium]HMR67110.1 cyclic nucleotide-binding domain-containing protein [Anaerolineae bacterium]
MTQVLSAPELNRLLATRPANSAAFNDKLNSPFYRIIAATDRIVLSKFMIERQYQPGQIIFREGEQGDSMFILWSGRAAVVKDDFKAPTILGYRNSGDIVGEMSVLESKPRSASVVALENLTASEIRRKDFERLLADNPGLSMTIMATLSNRLRSADEARKTSSHTENLLLRRVFDLQAQNQQLLELQEALYHTGHAISDTLNLAEVLELILEHLAKIVTFDRGSVLLQTGDKLETVAARGFPNEVAARKIRIRLRNNDIFDQIRQTQQPLPLPDVSLCKGWPHVKGLPRVKSWLGVPLIRFNQVVGMLSLARDIEQPFTTREINLAATFTSQAEIALANARLYDRIARFTHQLEEMTREPTGAVQAAFTQLEVINLLGNRSIPAGVFEALSTFLFYSKLSDLPHAVDLVNGLRSSTSSTYGALKRLQKIGTEVATYQVATSKYQQLAALARATDRLDDLTEYLVEHVGKQEATILEGIIHQWRRLISGTGAEVGASDTRSLVANPYVAGNPVTGDLFVGREDILRRLNELWGKEGHLPSVVIYGHRRMGKTSILHNMDGTFGLDTVIVDFNMQRVGMVDSSGEMLYNLALAMYDSLSPDQQAKIGEPDESRFIGRNPYTSFDRFLKKFDRVRFVRQRFVVTVDEFELIEQMIIEGKLEARLLDFWRGLIQTYSWFVMAFAGLHTLQEMTQDYWHPLFASVKAIPVSFLSRDAAWKLITQPTPDFELDYDAKAVERIITLTRGQPYLIQLIGHELVTRYNRQVFEQGVERQPRFTLTDVEAIINAPGFYRDGNAYFSGIWRLIEIGVPGGQEILKILTNDPATTEELAEQARLSLEETIIALRILRRHDIVERVDEYSEDIQVTTLPSPDESLDHFNLAPNDLWDFTVELMRRWVVERED